MMTSKARERVPTFRVRPDSPHDELRHWLLKGPRYKMVEALEDHGTLVLLLRGSAPKRKLRKKIVYSFKQAARIGPARLIAMISECRSSDRTPQPS